MDMNINMDLDLGMDLDTAGNGTGHANHRHLDMRNDNNSNARGRILDDMFSTLPTLEQIRRASRSDLLRQYSCGCTPLRHAIKHGATIDVVRLLLEKAPEAMEVQNSHGNVVLSHVKNTTAPDVGVLIAQLTSCVSLLQLDLDGDYPLHCLLQNKATDAVIVAAIERCPDAVFTHVNHTQRSALHEAIIHGASLDVIRKIAQRCPEALSKCDVDGKLPIHWIGHWTPLPVAEYLLQESKREAFYVADKEGRVPIHTSIQALASVPTIERMLEWGSEQFRDINDSGSSADVVLSTQKKSNAVTPTPTPQVTPSVKQPRSPENNYRSTPSIFSFSHDKAIVCQPTSMAPMPSSSISANAPKKLGTNVLVLTDRHGRTPIHMVLDYSASDIAWKNKLLKVLIQHSPTVVWRTTDNKGRLPLHCLRFISRIQADVLREMAHKTDPACLLEVDNRGRTPLHVALEDPRVQISTIQRLLGQANSIDEVRRGIAVADLCEPTISATTQRGQPEQRQKILDVYTSEGHLPLHTAALFQVNTAVLKYLFDIASPEQRISMRRSKDNQGCLPVHLAVQRRHARPRANFVDMLLGDDDETLLREDPMTHDDEVAHPLLAQDEVGQLPLHCAICFRTSTDILCLLVQRTPPWGFAVADFRCRIPLRCAIEGSTAAFIFQMILDKTPSSIFETSENGGNLILHHLPSSVSVDAVDLLSERYPQLLTTQDSSGRLPIHRAIVRLASVRVLENMINHAPETLLATDAEGRLPLHLLPDSGHSLDHIQLLISRSGQRALMTPDRYGQLPLHRAVSEEMRMGIIQMLVDACPQALEEFDHDEKLPLHHALLPSTDRAVWRAKRRRGVGSHTDPSTSKWAQWQKDLVVLLMSRSPQTLRMTDHLGRLPLHRAAAHISTIPTTVFQKLVTIHPEGTKVQDTSGRLPLHYALEFWNGPETSISAYVNTFAGRAPSFAGNVGFVENLQALLDSFSGAIYVKDNRGRLPLHLAMLADAPIDALFMLNRLAPDLINGTE